MTQDSTGFGSLAFGPPQAAEKMKASIKRRDLPRSNTKRTRNNTNKNLPFSRDFVLLWVISQIVNQFFTTCQAELATLKAAKTVDCHGESNLYIDASLVSYLLELIFTPSRLLQRRNAVSCDDSI